MRRVATGIFDRCCTKQRRRGRTCSSAASPPTNRCDQLRSELQIKETEMSLAEQIAVINRGFFSANAPADAMEQILSDGTQQIVNWQQVRPALLELEAMPWCQLQSEWRYFLDENRYPVGTPMELTPDRANIFRSLTNQLRQQITEPMNVLASVQPDIPADNVTVKIDATDLETIEKAIGHVREITHLAATDDAISVASLQPGSLEIILTAGPATLLSLRLAIILAKRWKLPRIKDDARRLLQVLKRRNPEDETSEAEVLEELHNEAKDEFWECATEALETVFRNAGKGVHESNEAKNKIEHAAKNIHDNADAVSTEWKLPPAATIQGLPGGMTVNLNIHDPGALAQVIRAITAPPDEK